MYTKNFLPRIRSNWLLVVLLLGIVASSAPTSAAYSGNSVTLTTQFVISLLDNEKSLPSVAYNSKHDEYLVVWHNNWGSNRDIYAQRISSKGELLSWFTVAPDTMHGYCDRIAPSVTYDPDNDRYLVVYMKDAYCTHIDWDVYGRFIPWDGPSFVDDEFIICNWTGPQWKPVVVYGRAQGEFMVVWHNSPSGQASYISAARLDHDTGEVIDDFTVSSGTQSRVDPDIAYNLARNQYLVVWDLVGAEHNIYGLLLNGVGSALGSEIAIAGWPDSEETPTVAACPNADQYLVGWQSLIVPPTDYDIYARYIAGDGTLGTVFMVDGTTGAEKNADVSCLGDGRQYLFAWQKIYTNAHFGISIKRIFPDGTLENLIDLAYPFNDLDHSEPAIAGGSAYYLVAWEHDRDNTAYQDIYGIIVYLFRTYLPSVSR